MANKTLCVRLPDYLYNQIERVAEHNKVTVSYEVRKVLEQTYVSLFNPNYYEP